MASSSSTRRYHSRKLSDLDLVLSGTEEALAMVEAGAKELPEAEMMEALNFAHDEVKKLCAFQNQFKRKEKMKPAELVIDPAIRADVESMAALKVEEILVIAEKSYRKTAWDALKKEVKTSLEAKYPETGAIVSYLLEDLFYRKARKLVLEKRVRTDGRKFDEIRPINCEIDLLPRAHGSALFTRGQTQALATVTLGNPSDMQIMDELSGEFKERFMLHYNFPGFATGEAKPERSAGRREIGHGNLARRSLLPLLPSEDEFPYTMRVVSDILESNGSSSMASICGGSLALFDAGVPMKSSCAGIAMGLIKEGDNYAILTDIMGMEDHLGDMDFKVAGTRKGITALQMDIKISGLTAEIMSKALEQARAGRMFILDKMEAAIGAPKNELSKFAPRMVSVNIPQSKIGELIGPGGKNIRRIQEDSGATIEVNDEGRVFISSPEKAAVDLAKQMVEYLTAERRGGEKLQRQGYKDTKFRRVRRDTSRKRRARAHFAVGRGAR